MSWEKNADHLMQQTIKSALAFTVVLVLSVCDGKLTWADHTKVAIQATSQPTVSKPPLGSGNLCAVNERTVFSCILEVNHKSVSFCASNDLSHFYYIYGLAKTPELIFSTKDKSIKNPFMRTFLHYMGGTAGYTFSFINNDLKYVIYYVTTRDNQKSAGVIVKHPNKMRAIQEISCRKNSIFESDDDDISNIVLKWPVDAEIDKYNLPNVH